MLAPMLLLALAPQGGIASHVVINEISYDNDYTSAGVDVQEFVELYNPTGQAVDISGWTLDSQDEAGPNPGYTIPASTMLPSKGFWVLGSPIIPNVNQIVGSQDLWEDSMESLELRDAQGALIDSVVYEVNKSLWAPQPPILEGEGLWGNEVTIPGIETTWSRVRDGWDTDDNGNDFRVVPWTPGATNDLPSLLTYTEAFEGYAPGTALPSWGGTFLPPIVIDPTVISVANPNAIVASPQGGNAAVFWDTAGGGNATMFLTDAVDSVIFEAFVYFDAVLEQPSETEVWTIGLQGTSSTFFNLPDPSRSFGYTANANTGIGWTYEVTGTAATLYLVDDNNGGIDHTVLGQIAIQPGVNDGWQRLRLQVSNNFAEGYFGGSYGQRNGTRVAGPIDGKIGGIYIGYREGVASQATVRPPTLDLVQIQAGAATTEVFGAPVPTTVGTPKIRGDGFPYLGESTFGVTVTGLVPNQSAGFFIGIKKLNPPVDLTLIGAQPNSKLYVSTEVSGTLPVTNASGETRLPLPVPAIARFAGARLYVQVFDLDANLLPFLPVGHSAGLQITIN